MSKYIVYTYQFSPILRKGETLSLLEDETNKMTIEEIMDNKQDTFKAVLTSNKTYCNKKNSYSTKVLYNHNNVSIFRLANNKYQLTENNFSIEKHPNHPSCLIIIDNRYNIQQIAIEETDAFSDTQTVVNILSYTYNKYLKPNRLSIKILKRYQEKEFWELINNHPEGISMVRFNFSYPNLPCVSECIDEMISKASKDVHSKQTRFEFNAGKNENLVLSEDNQKLVKLAKASARSGNEITLKINGIRSLQKTGNMEKSIEIDNLEVYLQDDLFQNIEDKLIPILNLIKE